MGVEFDGERQAMIQKMQAFQQMSGGSSGSSSSKFVQWLMNKGIVQSEAAGQRVLVGVVIANIIITCFVMFKFIL